jgi:preprotein translocase subunit YajC
MEMLLILLQATGAGEPNAFMQFLPLVLILVVFYFFFIRPQQKRAKEQKKFREALQKGQKVVTIGGIHGKIAEVKETTVVLDIGNNMKITVEKSAVAMDTQSIGQGK